MNRLTLRAPTRKRALGTSSLGEAALLGPDHVDVQSHRMQVADGWCASLCVVGYPREVGYGWLEPLTATNTRVDVALHVEPTPVAAAADRLRRQLARLESTRRTDAASGRLANPDIEVAAGDARDLADQLARGDSRLFRVGLTITVHADTADQLDAELARIRAVCAGMLLDAAPASWRQLQAWISTRPFSVDQLRLTRTFDTAALAAAYPFANADPALTTGSAGGGSDVLGNGVLYGTTNAGSGLLVWDRFAQDNHNTVILARSGSGKSYLAKLDVLRSLYRGVDVLNRRPRRRIRPARRRRRRHPPTPRHPARTPQPLRPPPPTRRCHRQRKHCFAAGCADPAGTVPAQPHRRSAGPSARTHDRSRVGSQPDRRLRGGRHHQRPRHPPPGPRRSSPTSSERSKRTPPAPRLPPAASLPVTSPHT